MNNILDLFSSVLKNPACEAPTADDFADTLDHLKLQAEHAQAMAQGSPDLFIKAATNIAAMDFFTVLNRFDTVPLCKRLEEKPELYFAMINTYVNFMKANLEQQKFEFKKEEAKARQREREEKLHSRKPILLTESTLETLRVWPRTLNSEPGTRNRKSQTLNWEPRTTNRRRRPTLRK